jgi:hypothetical protein
LVDIQNSDINSILLGVNKNKEAKDPKKIADNFKKQWAHMMKHDKNECLHFESREAILDELKITRSSKKLSKKYAEG